jgi:phage terminase large subunit-like protein
MGSGKTFSLLLDWSRYINTPGANGLIVRNRATDITIGGGLWDEAKSVYSETGMRHRAGNLMDMVWPSGAKLSFRHVDDRNVERFKGPGFNWIAFEEVNECPWDAVVWLFSRNRSTCGARPVVRMTTNPDPDHPIADLVAPYLHDVDSSSPLWGYPDRRKSGKIVYVLRGEDDRFVFGDTPEEAGNKAKKDPAEALSFSFIPSLLEDNRALAETDTKYRSKFGAMSSVDRARNERGNWKQRAKVRGMIDLLWIPWIETGPHAPILYRYRAWDLASKRPDKNDNKDPDFTIGIRVEWDIHGRWYVTDMVACREEPPEVLKLMSSTAASDGANVTQVVEIEGGAAGRHSLLQWSATLRSSQKAGRVVSVQKLGDKIVKFTPVADQLRLGMDGTKPRIIDYEQDPSGIWVPRGYQTGPWRDRPYKDAGEHPPTLGALFDKHMEAFFNPKVHDDVPDALAIAHAAHSKPKVKEEDPVQRLIRQS